MRTASAKTTRALRRLRRDEIESAALRSVLKHGFPGSSLRVVAKEAGLPLSILHYYFRDKHELMDRAAQRIFDATIAELEAVRRREPDPAMRIEALLETFTMSATENWRAMLAFIEYWAACVRRGSVDRFYTRVHLRLRELLTEAARQARADQPEQLGLSLLAMVTGYAMFYRSKEPDPAERAAFLKYAGEMVGRATRKGRKVIRAISRGPLNHREN